MNRLIINDAFQLAFRFVTETQESVFLTGKAGTGKTTFLKYLKENSTKNMVVAAPTGVAAINAGGVTLHSLFQLPLHPFVPTPGHRKELVARRHYGKQKLQLLRSIELLVIDEISMVRCDVLDAIDAVLRSVRRQANLPFGGVQLLCIGDLFQLPPVAQQAEWQLLQEYYNAPYFFESHAIKELQPLLIELTTVYRQKDDAFVQLLNKVRNHEMTDADFATLNQRYLPDFRAPQGQPYITLTTHNLQADRINEQELERINAPLFTYKAAITDDFPEGSYPAEANLRLKVGAQVMFLKNDTAEKKYFNGKIGIVSHLSETEIVVDCEEGPVTVHKEIWNNIRYTLNRETERLEEEILGSFEQYPLRLAWAVTIHKSQGLTFDRVMIDAAAAFSSGQVYVALSRCTRLEGLVLLRRIPPTALISNPQVVEGQQQLMHKGSLAERFAGARLLFTRNLLETVFLPAVPQQRLHAIQQLLQVHRQQVQQGTENWLQQTEQTLADLRNIGSRFLEQAQTLLQQQAMVEENAVLQQRIQSGAAYFLPRVGSLLQNLQQHPFTTESKETAAELDGLLAELYNELHLWQYLLQQVQQGFSVPDFLKTKLNYRPVTFTKSSYAAAQEATATTAAAASPSQPELYRILRSWRDAICSEQNIPVYLVAGGDTLQEICTYLPQTKEELLRIKGLGPAKVSKWGADLLDIVRDYCGEHQLQSRMHEHPGAAGRQNKPKEANEKKASHLLTLEQLQQGKSPEEIAAARSLTTGTIESHILRLIQEGALQAKDFLPHEQRIQEMEAVIKSAPDAGISEWRKQLGDDYSFFEIKLTAWLLEQAMMK
ncbi:MAG: helix-turn-helix domain-containing protein [Lacibacter sp.]